MTTEIVIMKPAKLSETRQHQLQRSPAPGRNNTIATDHYDMQDLLSI